MTTISPPPRIQFFTASGEPLANGKLYTYQAGTTTPKATYTSHEGLTANPNPIILDVAGSASVWLGYGKYDYALHDENDVLQYTQSGLGDPLPTSYVLEGIAGSNTIVADSADPPVEEYVPFMTCRFIAAANNTGATTINIVGLGAKEIAKDGSDALESGDIVQGALTTINYDGTRFQLLSEAQSIPPVALSCSGNSATATYATSAGTATWATDITTDPTTYKHLGDWGKTPYAADTILVNRAFYSDTSAPVADGAIGGYRIDSPTVAGTWAGVWQSRSVPFGGLYLWHRIS